MNDRRACCRLSTRLLLTLAVALPAAGCGSAIAVRTSPTRSSSTPAPHSLTAPPTAVATAAPTPPPLAVLEDDTGALEVVDGTGHGQWALTAAVVNKLVSTDPAQNAAVRIAGDKVLLFADHETEATPRPGSVAVIDAAGRMIGSGGFDAGVSAGDVAADPSGTQWAWSVDDTPTAQTQHHGQIMVAGLGIAKHSVYDWVAPLQATESVGAWTDMGIVMKRIAFGGCGAGFFGDVASFLIDPVAGTLTDLFSSDHYLDARHGVRVARAEESRSEVLVDGTDYDEPGTIVQGAYVSPDGTLVGVARLTPIGCGGGAATPLFGTELVTVATGAHLDRPGCEIQGWYDPAHYACSGQKTTLRDLGGSTVATLGAGAFLGVLQSSP